MEKSREVFMMRALELAELGRGKTSPNPMVGAVVEKNGKIIATGYHKRVGAPHAEAVALREAGSKAKGAELYLNLEPCAHVGRTPACADVVINSGVKKVYCAMLDPNPLNNGKGVRRLRKNGIKVDVGMMDEEARELNRVFVKYITKKIPFVTLKMAQSLDGKIAAHTGDSKWITSEEARDCTHRLRSEADAILVGVNTVQKDNPLLTSRRKKSPVKVILDPYLKVPESSGIFSKRSPSLSIIAVLSSSLKKRPVIQKIKRLNKKGVLVISCKGKKSVIDLECLLRELADLEIAHLLVEGGGNTAAGFLEQKLVDRIMFFIAPGIIGGKDALTSVEGRGVDKVKKSLRIKDMEVTHIGPDLLIRGDVA